MTPSALPTSNRAPWALCGRLLPGWLPIGNAQLYRQVHSKEDLGNNTLCKIRIWFHQEEWPPGRCVPSTRKNKPRKALCSIGEKGLEGANFPVQVEIRLRRVEIPQTSTVAGVQSPGQVHIQLAESTNSTNQKRVRTAKAWLSNASKGSSLPAYSTLWALSVLTARCTEWEPPHSCRGPH